MRKKIIAGNWKMNLNFQQAEMLTDSVLRNESTDTGSLIILAPPFIYLPWLSEKTKAFPHISLAAQNCSEHTSGAYTGEISASMLASLGITYCITGHSERRTFYHETDILLAAKINRLLENNLRPIFCCGESLSERESNRHTEIVKSQLHHSLFHLDAKEFVKCVVAYEPVWAIGTGLTASPEQAQEMHRFIRNEIARKYSQDLAGSIPLLYGGSVTPSNASDLFSCADVDGALVGGVSLKAEDFHKVIAAMHTKISG